jgi:hypothetical protein
LSASFTRAARFLYLQKTTWGGKVQGQTFNYRAAGPGRFIVSQVRRLAEEAANRLERVSPMLNNRSLYTMRRIEVN